MNKQRRKLGEYWRLRANQELAAAENTSDQIEKQRRLHSAADYERVAKRSLRLAKRKKP